MVESLVGEEGQDWKLPDEEGEPGWRRERWKGQWVQRGLVLGLERVLEPE